MPRLQHRPERHRQKRLQPRRCAPAQARAGTHRRAPEAAPLRRRPAPGEHASASLHRPSRLYIVHLHNVLTSRTAIGANQYANTLHPVATSPIEAACACNRAPSRSERITKASRSEPTHERFDHAGATSNNRNPMEMVETYTLHNLHHKAKAITRKKELNAYHPDERLYRG